MAYRPKIKNIDGTMTDFPIAAETATYASKLSEEWTPLIPSNTILPFGVYIIKVDISHNVGEVGNYGTTFVDIIGMFSDSGLVYEYRGFDLPNSGFHTYISNGYETNLYRTAVIKAVNKVSTGFIIDLFLSQSTGFAQSSSTITGYNLYPIKLASTLTGVSYTMKYKKLM